MLNFFIENSNATANAAMVGMFAGICVGSVMTALVFMVFGIRRNEQVGLMQ